MTQKKRLILIICSILVMGIIYLFHSWRTPRYSPYVLQFADFNTTCSITIWDNNSHKAETAARNAFHACNHLHRLINKYSSDSELSAFNRHRATSPFSVSQVFWNITQASADCFHRTDGYFDASVAPLIRFWKQESALHKTPDSEEVSAIRQYCGMNKLSFSTKENEKHFLIKSVPEMELDFGGIAKGYALLCTQNQLKRDGITCYLLNYGGNICCSATPPPGKQAFSIGLRDPLKENQLADCINVTNRSVSTSGNYERGKTLPHIFNPHTGAPCADLAAVTVITPSPVDSDAFSTAIFVGGTALAEKLTSENPDTTIILTHPDGTKIIIGAPISCEKTRK